MSRPAVPKAHGAAVHGAAVNPGRRPDVLKADGTATRGAEVVR